MTAFIIGGLFISLIISLIINYKIYTKNEKYVEIIDKGRREIEKIKNDFLSKEKNLVNKEKNLANEITKFKKFKDELINIEPGCKGIIADYPLVYNEHKDPKQQKVSFKITYEVDIIEVSTDKFKVCATNFSSFDAVGRDAANSSGILNFMTDKWIERSKVQIVVDDAMKRDHKLSQLGIK